MCLTYKGFLKKPTGRVTDLSKSIFKKAKKAEYSLMVMNKYVKSFLQYIHLGSLNDCFRYDSYGHAIVREELKAHVSFRAHNLIHDPMFRKCDIIFCVYVMIYFDDISKLKMGVFL